MRAANIYKKESAPMVIEIEAESFMFYIYRHRTLRESSL